MPHTIIYSSETHMIQSKIYGDLTLSEVKEVLVKFARIVKEKNCKMLLNDYREATVKLSTVEIYELPKIYADVFALYGLDVYRLKRALVAAKDLKDYLFFETVTFNRGQNAKVFYDIDEAQKWLSEK
jgi:hypothetical protein